MWQLFWENCEIIQKKDKQVKVMKQNKQILK